MKFYFSALLNSGCNSLFYLWNKCLWSNCTTVHIEEKVAIYKESLENEEGRGGGTDGSWQKILRWCHASCDLVDNTAQMVRVSWYLFSMWELQVDAIYRVSDTVSMGVRLSNTVSPSHLYANSKPSVEKKDDSLLIVLVRIWYVETQQG